MSNQQNNPEVSVDVARPNSLVNEQIYALKAITGKLKTAFMGHDVEWIDEETGNNNLGDLFYGFESVLLAISFFIGEIAKIFDACTHLVVFCLACLIDGFKTISKKLGSMTSSNTMCEFVKD